MFFRYDKGCRIPVDLDGMFSGSCFIAGGAPSLLKENLELLKQPGIPVLSMNNTASRVPTDFWLGLDKPVCYSPRILLNPKIMKFTMISRRNLAINENKMMDLPNMYFFGAHEKFNIHNFLEPSRDFWWAKNIFPVSLQIAYRLGFRRIYLIGCEFKITKESQYSYETSLNDYQVNYNQRLYNKTIEDMKLAKPYFKEKDFEIISCTPHSSLNEFYPTMSFEDVVKEMLKDFPKDYNTSKCVHSSELRNTKSKDIEKLKGLVKSKIVK